MSKSIILKSISVHTKICLILRVYFESVGTYYCPTMQCIKEMEKLFTAAEHENSLQMVVMQLNEIFWMIV